MKMKIKFQRIEQLEHADHMKCQDCIMAGRHKDEKHLKDCEGKPQRPQPFKPTYFLRDGVGFINARPLCAWCANRNATFAMLMEDEVEFEGALLSLPLPFTGTTEAS